MVGDPEADSVWVGPLQIEQSKSRFSGPEGSVAGFSLLAACRFSGILVVSDTEVLGVLLALVFF